MEHIGRICFATSCILALHYGTRYQILSGAQYDFHLSSSSFWSFSGWRPECNVVLNSHRFWSSVAIWAGCASVSIPYVSGVLSKKLRMMLYFTVTGRSPLFLMASTHLFRCSASHHFECLRSRVPCSYTPTGRSSVFAIRVISSFASCCGPRSRTAIDERYNLPRVLSDDISMSSYSFY